MSSKVRTAVLLGVIVTFACVRTEPPPDIILITVDTWRADRLSVYGGVTVPPGWLSEFAEQAVVFDEAIAPAPWTWPTLASIASGVYPSSHAAGAGQDPLCLEATTLPEVLEAEGWHTVFAGSNTYITDAGTGFEQGFAAYWGFNDEPAESLLKAVKASPRPRATMPTFVWMHLLEAHCPFDASEEVVARVRAGADSSGPPDEEFAAIVARTEPCFQVPANRPAAPASVRRSDYLAAYDAGLIEADEALRRIQERLTEAGLWDNAWVVLTGDHGEEFGEHGRIGHGSSVHREVARVPLLIKPPAGRLDVPRGTRVSVPVSLTDLTTTLAGMAGAEPDPSWVGRDLLDAMLGRPLAPAIVRSETDQGPPARLAMAEGYARVSGDGVTSVFNLGADPEQRAPITSLQGIEGLVDRLAAVPSAPPVCSSGNRPVSRREQMRLRALGYLSD